MEAITKERWDLAQAAEFDFQQKNMDEALPRFRQSYGHYFDKLAIEADQKGKRIIEIGCADIPAVYFCRNLTATIIEPLEYPVLAEIVKEQNYTWIKAPVEKVKDKLQADEVWLFNVMQHIIDPDAFVAICKKCAPVIRFFEPIDYPTCQYHPHTFSLQDYRKYFGDSVRFYKGGSLPGFHTADCAFGVWNKANEDGGNI